MDPRVYDAENPSLGGEKPAALNAAPRRGLLAERAAANALGAAPTCAPVPTDVDDGEPEYVSFPTPAATSAPAPTPLDCGFAVPLPSRARLLAAGAWLRAGAAAAAAAADGAAGVGGEEAAAAAAPLAARAAPARGGGASSVLGEVGGAALLAAAAPGAAGAWAAGDAAGGGGGSEDTLWGACEGGLLAEGGDSASAALASFSLGAFT
jgi:hypothetical protein